MSKNTSQNSCGLYLCVATGNEGAGVKLVEPMLASGKVLCLLVGPPPDGELDMGEGMAFVEAAKAHSVTVLVRDDAQMARSIKADGVHVSWCAEIVARLLSTREELGSNAIVGADAGRSRHDAMSLGDKGADYVAFGIPSHVGDKEKARSRQLDLIRWWGEIFEIPSVAFDVADVQHAKDLAANGADFIACDLSSNPKGGDVTEWFDGFVSAVAIEKAGV